MTRIRLIALLVGLALGATATGCHDRNYRRDYGANNSGVKYCEPDYCPR